MGKTAHFRSRQSWTVEASIAGEGGMQLPAVEICKRQRRGSKRDMP